MNKDLEWLINTGDITKMRTLVLIIGEVNVAYVTEYHMNTLLGEFKWWCTWKSDECNDKNLLTTPSIYIHDARARVFFPAFLDSRIPPENREGIREWLDKYGVKEYDKFDICIATKAISPIKRGWVKEVEPMHCKLNEIHAIDEIVAEYKRDI